MKLETRLRAYGDVECDISLSKKTTFRIGGTCKYFIYPKSELSLLRILDILKEEHIEVKIFGKGSNILCSDDAYEGAIINLDRYFTDVFFEEDGTVLVQAGYSTVLLAHEAMKNSLSGLEFASGIPGTVGGALFMNAGAYKSDFSKILKEVYVYKDDCICAMSVEDLHYDYRHSDFQAHTDWIILGARLQLTHGDQKEIRDVMDSRRKRRMDSQPLDKPCAGSMFRNPLDHQAWELIEQIGYRGKQIGGAMVSSKHANFIVNEQNATASDVMALVKEIQQEVKANYGIDLITEVEKFNWKI